MTDKTVYTVGYNVPGYLPTIDPYVCGSWEEATAAMAEELHRHADDLFDQADDQTVDDMVALDYAANVLETITEGRYWSVTIGGTEYWIHPETEQRIVYVVSFAPTGEERAVGGFDWYPVQWGQVAAMRFHRDVEAERRQGGPVSVTGC